MNYEFGEGEMRKNKAFNYVLAQLRYAQKKWCLSGYALDEILDRLRLAEKETSVHTFTTKQSLRHGEDHD